MVTCGLQIVEEDCDTVDVLASLYCIIYFYDSGPISPSRFGGLIKR